MGQCRSVIDGGSRVSYSEGEDKTKEYDPEVSLRRIEEQWISKALIHHSGNLVATAKALGVSRAKLYRRIESMGGSK